MLVELINCREADDANEFNLYMEVNGVSIDTKNKKATIVSVVDNEQFLISFRSHNVYRSGVMLHHFNHVTILDTKK